MTLDERHEYRNWYLTIGLLFAILADGAVIPLLIGLALIGVAGYQIFDHKRSRTSS